ncbi:hypothetical protein EYF80_032664 [Liparis tanakae]|uniref:Uncharacterized protein n=1 Tax=Liparis tanakae TaxID=230148 RepID=A0A4Z2GUG8_9TELE|nr:hypothetical protein EYF80_032664 [Liparis tanakae]
MGQNHEDSRGRGTEGMALNSSIPPGVVGTCRLGVREGVGGDPPGPVRLAPGPHRSCKPSTARVTSRVSRPSRRAAPPCLYIGALVHWERSGAMGTLWCTGNALVHWERSGALGTLGKQKPTCFHPDLLGRCGSGLVE